MACLEVWVHKIIYLIMIYVYILDVHAVLRVLIFVIHECACMGYIAHACVDMPFFILC